MKKGFTLVELIISISLILIISSSVTFFVLKNKDSDLTKIEKEIANAANLYLSLEKDENSYSYLNGIQKGGKGVYLNINTLVSSGYLDKSILDELEEETTINRTELKLLAVNAVGTNNSEECGTGLIEYKFNWDVNSTDTIYLCPYDINYFQTSETYIDKILEDNILNTEIVNDNTCKNGLFIDMDNDGATYFFRGDVNNNYIKFGKDKNGNELLWRIVRINGDKTLRLILNENILYGILNKDNTIRNIGCFSSSPTDDGYFHLVFDNNKILTTTYAFSSTGFGFEDFYNTLFNYWQENVVAIDSTIIDEQGKFCDNKYSYIEISSGAMHKETFIANKNFKCEKPYTNYSVNEYCYYGNNSNIIINKKIGQLSYGEYLMGTNTSSTCELNDGYLSGSNYILSNQDFYEQNSGIKYNQLNYYFSNLKSNKVYYYNYKEWNNRITSVCLSNIRPVINLKSDIKLSGNGTQENPYIIDKG